MLQVVEPEPEKKKKPGVLRKASVYEMLVYSLGKRIMIIRDKHSVLILHGIHSCDEIQFIKYSPDN